MAHGGIGKRYEPQMSMSRYPTGEHIVMETSENGSAIISDGTGTMPAF